MDEDFEPYEGMPTPPPGGYGSMQISVSAEFNEHFATIKHMRDEICSDPEAKDSAKAQILNTTTTIIRDLLGMAERIHNAENWAKLRQAVVECLKEESVELQDRVIASFERRKLNG